MIPPYYVARMDNLHKAWPLGVILVQWTRLTPPQLDSIHLHSLEDWGKETPYETDQNMDQVTALFLPSRFEPRNFWLDYKFINGMELGTKITLSSMIPQKWGLSGELIAQYRRFAFIPHFICVTICIFEAWKFLKTATENINLGDRQRCPLN